MKYRIEKLKENICIWIAWRLPKHLVQWCYIRVHSYATMGKYGMDHPDSVSWNEALKRFDLPNVELKSVDSTKGE